MPRLCELYPGICLTAEEKAWKTLSQGSRRVPVSTVETEYTEQNVHNNENYNEKATNTAVFILIAAIRLCCAADWGVLQSNHNQNVNTVFISHIYLTITIHPIDRGLSSF